MTAIAPPLLDDAADLSALRARGADPDQLFADFAAWAESNGTVLYPAQEEALIELVSGANVVLATPTGSGKSLVATGAQFAALAAGRRSYYTAPIKALVSEKFFALCGVFGAANVGMLTGDASVNHDAPIIACTAEVLANIALREGAEADIGLVVMDEFHFYGDPDRGWAWQVPLLELPKAQFLLMSATLGDVSFLREDLTRRTGRPTALVANAERPVPLHHYYATTPMHETIQDLLDTKQAPVYVVHFTQASALERAQALMSVNVCTKEEKAAIADMIGGFRFSSAFGTTLSRLVRHGIGVHHAGMLPKYRRLVEQLAQAGLLKVICGTDTLGVGINVPIRTVVFSALSKYDGTRTRLLQVREFHQIAGRAGRAGYDTAGTVVVQAPEHEVENLKQFAKVEGDPKKLRKLVRKKAPEGMVPWSAATMNRLIESEPEKLTSNMRVSTSMILDVVDRPGDPFVAMRRLLTENHEPRKKQLQHIRDAIGIARSLLQAGVLERLPEPEPDGRRYDLTLDLPPDFALNQPLSTFALAAHRGARPGVGHLSPRRRERHRSHPRRPAPDPRRAAEQGEGRGRRPDEGRGHRVRRAHGTARGGQLPEAARGAARTRLRGVSADQSVGGGRRAVAEVRRPGDVGAGVHLPRVREHLRAHPFRGSGAALPVRRVQGAALRRARRCAHRGGDRPRRVARRAGAPGRLVAARRVGAADQPGRRDGRRGRRPRPAAAAHRQRAGVHRAWSATRCSGGWSSSPADAGTTSASWTPARAGTPTGGKPSSGPTSPSTTRCRPAPTPAAPRCSSSTSPSPGLWRVRQILDDPAGDHDWGFDAEVDLEASDEEGAAVLRLVDAGRKD